MLNPYDKLSRFYDIGWGDFSIQYLDLINELLREHGIKQARILDIACGTGNLTLELAQQGHHVCGTDISSEMIDIAKKKAKGFSNLTYMVRDMTEAIYGSKFDMVTCTYDSINYLRRLRDVFRMLSGAASVLDTGGLFIFDSNTKYLYMKHADELLKREISGEKFLQQCSINPVIILQQQLFLSPTERAKFIGSVRTVMKSYNRCWRRRDCTLCTCFHGLEDYHIPRIHQNFSV